MDDTELIITVFFTLLASAFFSGTEIAFVSANRLKIELDRSAGTVSGKILSRFVKKPESFISAMLLGNNAALVIYGLCMGMLLEPVIRMMIPNEAVVLIIQTILSTLLILVTAEFLPKAIFQINPNRILSFTAIPLFIIYFLLYIPTSITLMFSNIFLRLFRMDTRQTERVFSKVDLDYFVRDMNERLEEESELTNEMQILQNALDFSKVKARDCMIPRTEIIAMEIDEDIEDLRQKFVETGLSKIIIYRDNIDNIIGYVHSFELFKKPNAIKQILLPMPVVPESVPGKELLELFARQSGNIAVVVDEFGGTSGLITIEDLIEEIFGDIEDEHDHEELIEEQIDENTFIFSARQEIDYLNENYNLNLPEMEDFDTLGGMVLYYLESIPEKGDKFKLENTEIEVIEVSDRRVELIRLIHTDN
ncbi:hemolysin family protein [Wandonia haliotis]|uniref:Hemolysin family protein n=1 Tax=Wandonia haliotis TaxID=574963 RepID=A0ABN1MML7_9FLAO